MSLIEIRLLLKKINKLIETALIENFNNFIETVSISLIENFNKLIEKINKILLVCDTSKWYNFHKLPRMKTK